MLSIVARVQHSSRSSAALLGAATAAAVRPSTRSISMMRQAPLRPQLHLTPSSVALGLASRQLSLWPFGRSNNNAEAKVEEFVKEGQDKAHEAAQQLKDTAHDAAASASSTLDAAAQKSSEVAQSVSSEVHAATHGDTGSHIIDAVAAVNPDIANTLAEAAEATHIDMATLQQNHGTIISSVQSLLDFTQNATGLPWWATVAAVTVSIRLLLVPVVLYGQTNAIRLANIQPQLAESMETIRLAQQSGDQVAMMAAAKRSQALLSDNNCHPLRSFLVPVVQGPLFITFFLALKGLGEGGLTALKTGGLGWVTDLTAADPFVALPILGSALTLVTLETGAEMGATPQAKTQQQKVMRNVLRGFCVVVIPLVWNFPAIVFFYMVTNSLFSLCQLLVLKTSWAKRVLNIPDRKQHDTSLVGRRVITPSNNILDKAKNAFTGKPAPRPSQTPNALRARAPAPSRDAAMRELTEEPASDTIVVSSPAPTPAAAAADRADEARRKRVADANAKRKQRSRV